MFSYLIVFFLTTRPPPTSTLFPYTTLFRSTTCSPSCQQANFTGALANESTSRPSSFLVSKAPVKDRKSTRLNSSHRCISYAVFCLKKKKKIKKDDATLHK